MNRNPANYGSIRDPEVGFSGTRNKDTFREFNSLCDDIATKLYTINASFKALQDCLKLIGTAKDNTGVRNKIHVTQLTANQVASATTRDIAKLKRTTPRHDKHRLLQADKLEEDFKEALSKYHILQKELAEKQKANLLLSTNVERGVSDDEDNEEQQKQMQLNREMQFEQEMMLEREERVKQIEADVLDINQIMRELGSLVYEQGEVISTIENSIDHAGGNVAQGTEELIKASGYQNRYRKKILILVIVAAIIAIILIAVLVSELKK
ncbi:syntaxin-7 [Euwallacea similis]|uniref:syntaxin-7 n=1 Tax=Euwallacea similis TaxID=1736056 RepID=UPI00345008B4